jgi:hypothetical protein
MDEIFPAVRVPILVLQRAGDAAVPSSSAQRVASRIPGVRLLELPGSDHLPYVGDSGAVVEAIRQFLAGQADPAPGDRQLVTLLATDALDAESEVLVRRHVRRLDGAEIPSHAGGVLTKFGTATTAIRYGLGIVDAARRQGTGLRVGVHTGECEVTRADLDPGVGEQHTTILQAAICPAHEPSHWPDRTGLWSMVSGRRSAGRGRGYVRLLRQQPGASQISAPV